MTAWDEPKRARNKAKHGIDLALAKQFEFEAALVTEDTTEAHGEQRFRAIGPIGNRLYVYTLNNETMEDHAISLRPAEPQERRCYAQNI